MQITATVITQADVAHIRYVAKLEAQRLGFRSAKVYRFATAVSELANNLHFHAVAGGTICLGAIEGDGRLGIEVISQDQGPGIADITAAMQDGFSTNRGLGGGLPGVQRLMDEFSIESVAGSGTRVAARLWLP